MRVDGERKMSQEATAKLKAFSVSLELEPAVREIIEQLLDRKYIVIPGARARLTYRLARFIPAVLNKISDGIVRKALAS